MEQELHKAFCPLHSLHRGGGANPGSSFLPACPETSHITPPTAPSHAQTAGLKHWVKLSLHKLRLLSALHLLCTGRRGQRGRKPLLQTFTCVFKAPEEVFFFFARTTTFHPQDNLVQSTQVTPHRKDLHCLGSPEPGSGSTNLPLFDPASRDTGQKRTPAVPSVLPSPP